MTRWANKDMIDCYCLYNFFSAGGLVTAVAPVVIRGSGIWVGWPGIHLDDPNEKIPESDPNDKTPTAGLRSSKVCFIKQYLQNTLVCFSSSEPTWKTYLYTKSQLTQGI